MNPTNYNGTYRAEGIELPIVIENNFSSLTAIINNIRFTSPDMEEWTLSDEVKYDDSKLATLSISSFTEKHSFNLITKYILDNCFITFSIPQKLINKRITEEIETALEITVKLKENNMLIDLKIEIEDDVFIIKSSTMFEQALKAINDKIAPKYILLNCFNCHLSSYNVFGSSVFGSLLCFKKYKERFLKINSKTEYAEVQYQGYETVQETHYCEEFELLGADQYLYK